MPIQIGLPSEVAWEVAEPEPISYLAFLDGEELPDPGSAFIAAGESFGVAPQDVQPLPLDEERVAWAFSFTVPRRAARIMLWCERAVEGASPDGQAHDARWVLFIETLLDTQRPVDDAVALAATVARTGGQRTRLLFDPALGVAWNRGEFSALFLTGDAAKDETALVDERHLYRVEVVARDRAKGPFWISTVGMARAGKPELEILEVPVSEVRAALELMDALAARFLTESLPHAGVPFEAGPELSIALVPAHEVIETLSLGAAGDASDRRGLPRGPRAAICAAGRRGSFRSIWTAPSEVLVQLARQERGLYIAPRVSAVRERVARHSWGAFVRAHASRGHDAGVAFLVKIASEERDGEREHLWISAQHADGRGGRGLLARSESAAVVVDFTLEQVGDWRVVGFSAELPEVGPESADRIP